MAEDQVQGISSFACGREAVECQGEGMHKKEKARGLKLVGGEVDIFEDSERDAVGREKIEECPFLQESLLGDQEGGL